MILKKIHRNISKEQLKKIEKKPPCHITEREFKIISENIEENFGRNSKMMSRVNKIEKKMNRCNKNRL